MPVSRNSKKNGFRLETCRNDDRKLIFLWSLDFGPSSSFLTLPSRSGSPRSTGCAGGFGMRLSERSELCIPPAHSSIAGHPQGGHVGCHFFWLLFFRQVKKSHSPIKGEKKSSVLAQFRNKTRPHRAIYPNHAPAQQKSIMWRQLGSTSRISL